MSAKNITWNDLNRREDLVGGFLSWSTDGIPHFTPIKEWRVRGGQVSVIHLWRICFNQNWQSWEVCEQKAPPTIFCSKTDSVFQNSDDIPVITKKHTVYKVFVKGVPTDPAFNTNEVHKLPCDYVRLLKLYRPPFKDRAVDAEEVYGRIFPEKYEKAKAHLRSYSALMPFLKNLLQKDEDRATFLKHYIAKITGNDRVFSWVY
jgi:hypothetical protein